jgi:hypothetical protein
MQQRLGAIWHFAGLGALVLSAALWSTGCDSAKVDNAGGGADHGDHDHGDHDHGDHGHDHAHDHAHGPHGGEIIEIGDEEYHAEYLKTDDGTVTVYVLDASMKNEVPIAAEEIAIDTKVGDKATTFKLAAVDRTEGDEPKTAKFEVVDKELAGVLVALSDGVTATLKLDINGKPYEANIEKVDHHH